MRVALLCPSNILYMPYVGNYEKVLKESNADYQIINWDRFHIENNTEANTYRDIKIGHQRTYFDYLKYKKFILERLDNFDRVIIFGIQLTYFFHGILLKNFKNKYIIDIRDYNKIIKFFNIKKTIDNSLFTVISSPAYKEWLPNSNKYIVNHNTTVNNLELLSKTEFKRNPCTLNISYIGSLANFDVNVDFINALQNNDNFNLIFHGEGTINNNLKAYIKQNKIRNVIVNGRYDKKVERELYSSAHLINMLLYNNNINNRTCLANRLYNSVLYAKPMIALEGTFISKQIKTYNLGLVLDSFHRIDEKITNYINCFDIDEYNIGRKLFYTEVISQNKAFQNRVNEFVLS